MHVQLRQISKRFADVVANRAVDLEVRPGTIHGVLGENGAGKSTLMKILAGYTAPSAGQILFDGEAATLRSPADAARLGVGMLYQEAMDFPALTSVENFLVGRRRGRWLRPDRCAEQLGRRGAALGFSLHPHQALAGLTLGERQQLELLRLLALDARLLILDEPTTGISDDQKQVLFRALRALADDGRSILLVSHKLEEVEALCDRTTVLRQGAVAGELTAPYLPQGLLQLMFAAPSSSPPPSVDNGNDRGEAVLTLRRVTASGGRAGMRQCSAVVRAGEIVGLAGVAGSGQGAFLRVAAGVQRPRAGTAEYHGSRPGGRRDTGGRWAGRVFLPAARLEEGLIPGLTVWEHFALNQPRLPLRPSRRAARRRARAAIEEFRIKGREDSLVEALSGGNQQRLLLSLLPPDPRLLLLENPTRGLDLESAGWVWGRLHDYRQAGAAVVFSSAELDEIVAHADRVLVFYEGHIILDTTTAASSPAVLAAAIAGRVEGREVLQ